MLHLGSAIGIFQDVLNHKQNFSGNKHQQVHLQRAPTGTLPLKTTGYFSFSFSVDGTQMTYLGGLPGPAI
jgi:hypothetical protein